MTYCNSPGTIGTSRKAASLANATSVIFPRGIRPTIGDIMVHSIPEHLPHAATSAALASMNEHAKARARVAVAALDG